MYRSYQDRDVQPYKMRINHCFWLTSLPNKCVRNIGKPWRLVKMSSRWWVVCDFRASDQRPKEMRNVFLLKEDFYVWAIIGLLHCYTKVASPHFLLQSRVLAMGGGIRRRRACLHQIHLTGDGSCWERERNSKSPSNAGKTGLACCQCKPECKLPSVTTSELRQ